MSKLQSNPLNCSILLKLYRYRIHSNQIIPYKKWLQIDELKFRNIGDVIQIHNYTFGSLFYWYIFYLINCINWKTSYLICCRNSIFQKVTNKYQWKLWHLYTTLLSIIYVQCLFWEQWYVLNGFRFVDILSSDNSGFYLFACMLSTVYTKHQMAYAQLIRC